MADFLDENWRETLAARGLDDFEALWALEIGWFEEPNQRRGGWSGVSRMEIDEGAKPGLFIKRQLNHTARTPTHPIKGILTFEREFANILLYRRFGIPTLTPVYFACREASGEAGDERRAILITEELGGFVPLEDVLRRAGGPGVARRKGYAQALARVAADMHRRRIQHNCFYPKHLFVREHADDSGVDVRVIDLEKTKRPFSRRAARLRDLDALNRHTPQCSRSDRLRFLLAYTGAARLSPGVKKLWRELAALDRKKHARKAGRKHV